MKKILSTLLLIYSINAVSFSQDNFHINYTEINDTIIFEFHNNTNDTKYLFSTYFFDDYLFSKYIQRINKKHKTYTISFVPLIPYLTNYLSDRIILGEDKIISVGQNLYHFITIKPGKTYTLKLPEKTIFLNANKKHNSVNYFKFKNIKNHKIKKYTLKKLRGKYQLFFEFAIYDKIELLQSKNADIKSYYQSRNYETFNVPVFIKNYKLPLQIKKTNTVK